MKPNSKSGRLLIVDDDPTVLQTHVRVLSEYAPLRAEDGLAARGVLSDAVVDVVVCDLGMPRMGGLDLMRWAKEQCPRPLWIVVSAQETFDAVSQALKLGAFDFIAKPVSPMQLRTAVANAFRHQELLDERAALVLGLKENNTKLTDSLTKLEAAYEVLQEQRSMLDQDLRRAERIMRALLPPSLPAPERMQLDVGYRPSNVIGGDLYGAAMVDARHLAVYVADAAGHGVSAALLAVLFKQRLRLDGARGEPRPPAEVLADLNRDLLEECRASGLFVTVALALVDTESGIAAVASAGHPPLLLVRSEDPERAETVEKTGPALGLTDGASFHERRVELRPGDRLLFYSDGLTGALSRGRRPAQALLDALREVRAESDGGVAIGAAAIDRLLSARDPASADEDDVTLLLLTARSGAPAIDAPREAPAIDAPREAPAIDAQRDASTSDAQRERAVSLAPAECRIRVGRKARDVFVAVEGRAIWKHAPLLREACIPNGSAGGAAGAGSPSGACGETSGSASGETSGDASESANAGAVVDLGDCAMLDSTVLGTLHEIATTPGLSFRLQNVSPELRALFEELAMTRVLSSVTAAEPLPGTMVAAHVKADASAQGLVLRAHELLAGLSPRNAEEFAPVIEVLRGEP